MTTTTTPTDTLRPHIVPVYVIGCRRCRRDGYSYGGMDGATHHLAERGWRVVDGHPRCPECNDDLNNRP